MRRDRVKKKKKKWTHTHTHTLTHYHSEVGLGSHLKAVLCVPINNADAVWLTSVSAVGGNDYYSRVSALRPKRLPDG